MSVSQISKGAVTYLNLAANETIPTWLGDQRFDWVLSIEVAEHVPREHSENMIRTWDSLARYGVIMSWSEDTQGIGHVNPVPFKEAVGLVERVVSRHLSCLILVVPLGPHVASGLGYYVKGP